MKKLYKINTSELNFVKQIFEYHNPEYIYLPINKENNIEINTKVYKNTYLDKELVTVSGKIIQKTNNYYIIKNDFLENQKKVKIPKVKNKVDLLNMLDVFNYKDIYTKITKKEKPIVLVLTSIDKENCLFNEFMYLANNSVEILETLDNLAKMFKIENIIIAIKNTNFESIKNVKSLIGIYPNIKIVLVPDKYLIHKPFFLKSLLNLNDEAIYLNSEEVYTIYNLLKGKIPTDKYFTISGNAIKRSLVVKTRIGVSLKELVKEFIEFTLDDYEVFVNGIMPNNRQKINNVIVNEKTLGVVINKCEHLKSTECINCGACLKICPFNINVKKCYFNNLKHKKCINCGLCNYICPSNIDLQEVVGSGVYEEK